MKPAIKTYAYLKKDTLLLTKRKKYLYLFILLPLVIASLFLFALNPKEYEIRVGVCDFDNTEISNQAFQDLSGFETIILEEKNCIEELQEQIKSGKLNLGIEIGEGFSQNLQDLKQSKLIVYYDSTDIAFANLISWKIDQSLEPFEKQVIDSLNQEVKDKTHSAREGIDIALEFSDFSSKLTSKIKEADKDLQSIEEMSTEFLTNPIWTDKRPIDSEDLQSDATIIYIFPILAIFIILMLSSTSIIYDKNTGFITRVKASYALPQYILAKLIFFTGLAAIQFTIILLLFMASGASYALPFSQILHLILFIGITDALIGLILGLIAENEGIAVLFSLMISFPLMLVSGIFFPIQTLPKVIQWISSVLPVHYHIQATKQVLLFSQSFQNTWVYIAIPLIIILYFLARKIN